MDDLKVMAARAVELLLGMGADEASCYASVADCEEVQCEAKSFNLLRSYSQRELRLKAQRNRRTGSVSINRFDPQSLEQAARDCIAETDNSTQDEFSVVAERGESADFVRGVFTPDMGMLSRRLAELARDIDREYPNIVYDIGGSYEQRKTVFANSEGVVLSDKTGAYSVYTGYSARADGKTTSFGQGSFLVSFDPDTRLIDLGDNREQLETAMRLLNPSRLEEKFTGRLIATPDFVQTILYYVLQNALSDAAVTSGAGRWNDTQGQSVADEKLSVGFTPLSPELVLCPRFSSDGVLLSDVSCIEQGVLRSFLLSHHGSRASGRELCGNTGYGMCVSTGKTPLADMIRSTSKGLLVARCSGTEPDFSGELSGVAKNSFYIENGEVKGPVTETMMSCNIFELLKSISAVSREARRDGYSVIPYIAFDGVTVK